MARIRPSRVSVTVAISASGRFAAVEERAGVVDLIHVATGARIPAMVTEQGVRTLMPGTDMSAKPGYRSREHAVRVMRALDASGLMHVSNLHEADTQKLLRWLRDYAKAHRAARADSRRGVR